MSEKLNRVVVGLTDAQLAKIDAEGGSRAQVVRDIVDAHYDLTPVEVKRGPKPGTHNGGGWTRRKELLKARSC